MSVSLFNQNLKEARRDALVSHYLAAHDFSSLPEGSSVTTADDLYEYLLLDTKISNAVTTSRLAEAISSLQLFIHRSLEGYEGELAEDANHYLAKDAFLDNWDLYNKRYSTWAGKEKLRFYAGNYVEPSLRLRKSKIFNDFENKISQAKISENNAKSALRQYVYDFLSFESLHYLSAIYDSFKNEIHFIALMPGISERYFWRTLELRQDEKGTLIPLAWREWLEINLPIKNIYTDEQLKQIGFTFTNDQLTIHWMTEEKSQDNQDEVAFIYFHYKSTLTLNEWGEIQKDVCQKNDEIFDTWGSINNDFLSMPSDMHSDDIPLFSAITLWLGDLLAVSPANKQRAYILFKYKNAYYVRIFSLSENENGKYTPVNAVFTGKLNTSELDNFGNPGMIISIHFQNGIPVLSYSYENQENYYYDISDVEHPKKTQAPLNIKLTYLIDFEDVASVLSAGISSRERNAKIERYSRDAIKKFQSGDDVKEYIYPAQGVFPAVIATEEFEYFQPVTPDDNFTDDVTFEVTYNSDGSCNIKFDFSEEFTFSYCSGDENAEKMVPLKYITNLSNSIEGLTLDDFSVFIEAGILSGELKNLKIYGDESIQDLALVKVALNEFNGDKFCVLICGVKFSAIDNALFLKSGEVSENAFKPSSYSILGEFNRYQRCNDNYIKLMLPGLYNESRPLYNVSYSDLNSLSGDFYGAGGIYLWELFFHIPYLVATRFATEQRFEEAERWYKYIFNSAGYRDEDGNIQTDDNGLPRYWNCYPLQQDVAWDSFADMPASTDPDVIATADPMHYRLAIFQHTLDLLIARGDAAYRLLERDTLTEAKMYYVQALQLLGPRPDIRVTNTWDNPTLSDEADAIQDPVTRGAEGASLTFAQWLRAGDANDMGDGDFLPPYNDVLLAYWDKLDIRLYNLRHNLSLDGQPLSLPLFATPVDPAELHRQQSGGDGVQGDVSPADSADTGWRYPLLAVKAQESVLRLKEFGSGVLSALEKQDSEKVTMLLQSQQNNVLGLQQEIAQKNLESLNAELAALNSSREGLVLNQKYYASLINGDLSAAEITGLALRGGSMLGHSAAALALLPAGALRAIPNIFGLAAGGADLGAPVEAGVQSMLIAAQVLDQSAAVSEITASYQRRAEDWRQQSELAAKSIEETDNRIDSLKAQIAMQQKQIALAEMEYANQQAYLDLYNSRFTGLTLYSWMVSRLSSLYYQLYDATIPVCIQAREALKRELGNSKTDGIFSTPVWNDLYQGLLAGEGLTTELQKLESVWIQNSAGGLEATRTVSLAVVRGEESGSLSAAIAGVLNKGTDDSEVGQLTLDNSIFSAVLDMSTLQLADDYGPTSSNKTLFTKSIAVTLPTLLGPYQDIAATLSDDKGTVATLSHGMQDTGRFVVNFDDSRFLPFEGRDPRKMTLTLSIFNVKDASDAAPNQRSIVENLSDIIFHIRYIMRDGQS